MKIVKTMVNAKTRQLAAGYTVIPVLEMKAMTADDILAQEIMAELDRSLEFDLRASQGWTIVATEATVDEAWLEEHMQHKWASFRGKYAFEAPYDSVLFALRWP